MDFNLNNINKKITLFFSLFGFILSFITGIIARNSFINLFFRSILSGIVIGIVIALANILIMLFLPELLEDLESEDSEDSNSDGQVDIIMPNEGYTVQTSNNSDVEGESASENNTDAVAMDQSFKEVGLDNLENLSTSSMEGGESFENYKNDDDLSSSPSKVSDSELENHSVEEMAKAVKTVLKKD